MGKVAWGSRGLAAAVLLCGLTGATKTSAQQRVAEASGADTIVSARARAKVRTPAAPALGAPEAHVELILDAPSPRGRWSYRVVNLDDIPVRIIADARVLTFDITPLGARRAQHCGLPLDMRPADDMERAIVLPPHRTYSETFDARLFCFSGAALDALAADSIVIAHLGWRSKSANGPKVLSPLDGITPEVTSRPQLDAPPVSLPDEVVSEGGAVSPPKNPETDEARLALQAPETVEAASPDDVVIPLTLRNEGSRRRNVRFRPDVLGFDISGSSGTAQCQWPTSPAAPTRELFTTVSRGHPAYLEVLLGAYCTGHELDQPGVLVVWPWLDTRSTDTPDLGFPTFGGAVAASRGTYVRLHRGRRRPPAMGPSGQ
jgi:hypothetical protein